MNNNNDLFNLNALATRLGLVTGDCINHLCHIYGLPTDSNLTENERVTWLSNRMHFIHAQEQASIGALNQIAAAYNLRGATTVEEFYELYDVAIDPENVIYNRIYPIFLTILQHAHYPVLYTRHGTSLNPTESANSDEDGNENRNVPIIPDIYNRMNFYTDEWVRYNLRVGRLEFMGLDNDDDNQDGNDEVESNND